jgi:hypothetical protein
MKKIEDWIKANRKGSREAELMNQTGWVSKSRQHASIKDYNRKPKHKSKYGEDNIRF